MTSVLVAHPFPDRYGVDRMLLETLETIRDRGMGALVVVPEHGPLLEDLNNCGFDYRIVPFPVIRRAQMSPSGIASLALGALPAVRKLRSVLREARPDLLYVNTLTLPHWLVAARSLRVPSVCHVHEADDRMPPPLAKALVSPLLLATRVVTVSAATREFVTGAVGRLSSRTVVVHNGMRFPPAPLPAPSRVPAKLLLIGRLGPHKGQDLAIDALATLVDQGRDVELELAGSVFRGYSWYEQALRDQVHDLQLDQRVHFSGFRSDSWNAYREADIVIVPSRSDPLPLVAIEALAMARPVVAANVGGLPEIVMDGSGGLLCRPDDADDLARAIATLLDDSPLANRLAQEGSDDARRRFGVDVFRRNMAAVLSEVLELPPRVDALATETVA